MIRRPSRSRSVVTSVPLLATLLLFGSACSGDGSLTDQALEPLVGDWTAVEFEVTSQEDPDLSIDVLALGATFTINVQPSGQYTAVLTLEGEARPELGRLEVDGSSLIFHVEVASTGPRSDTATFTVDGGEWSFWGPTLFPFQAGPAEPADLEVRLTQE